MIQHTKRTTSIKKNIYDDQIINASTNKNTDIEIEMNYQHCSTSMSSERIFKSPTKDRLWKLHRNEIKKLKNQLYISLCKIKRTWETIKSLKSILKDLQKRNLLILQQSDILKYLD